MKRFAAIAPIFFLAKRGGFDGKKGHTDRSDCRGFLYIETLVTTLIVTIFLLGFTVLMYSMVWHMHRAYYYDTIVQDVVAFMEEGKAHYIAQGTLDGLEKTMKSSSYTVKGVLTEEVYQGMPFSEYRVSAYDDRGELFAVETYLPPHKK